MGRCNLPFTSPTRHNSSHNTARESASAFLCSLGTHTHTQGSKERKAGEEWGKAAQRYTRRGKCGVRTLQGAARFVSVRSGFFFVPLLLRYYSYSIKKPFFFFPRPRGGREDFVTPRTRGRTETIVERKRKERGRTKARPAADVHLGEPFTPKKTEEIEPSWRRC